MEGMRTGLRHRIRRSLRQVEEQHQGLRRIAAELDRALAADRADAVDRWLDHFLEALTAHFDVEEEVLFPAVHGLDASTAGELERLEHEHGEFLAALRALAADSGLDDAERAKRIGSLRIGLGEHERREERVIGSALESNPEK